MHTDAVFPLLRSFLYKALQPEIPAYKPMENMLHTTHYGLIDLEKSK